jgi:kynureninase
MNFALDGASARKLDQSDELREFRSQFCIPVDDKGEEQLYLCGNSLGLQPKALAGEMAMELDQWSRLAVRGHFEARFPWLSYHEFLREHLAELVGAQDQEVVAMNSLTVNLHLMMVSFYRPSADRHRIVIEKQAFPSDRYAVESQVRFHGLDPAKSLVELEDSPGSARVSGETLATYLEQHGDSVALVLLPGVQYFSGQLLDMAQMTRLAHDHGCRVGFDLAHAVGNVPLKLHDWGCDFAVWCSYKYLNGGAGAVAGCFVHQRHSGNRELPRFAGWWGHEQETRFQMGPKFIPSPGADAWQLSNPPIMALAPVRVSLDIFHAAGMDRLRAKSMRLTAYMKALLEQLLSSQINILTPSDPAQRGCQLSIQVDQGRESGRRVFEELERRGVICDWREPDVIRVAPTPLYNRFEEVHRFAHTLQQIMAAR